MASRDINLLHPSLKFAWLWLEANWKKQYPDRPQPFITATYRSHEEQQEKFDSGASKALPGQSLHNYSPAYAFDVAFDPKPGDGVGNDVTWAFTAYDQFGQFSKENLGLVWGGDFEGLVDGPHHQLPMTWEDARDGHVIIPPRLIEKARAESSQGQEKKVRVFVPGLEKQVGSATLIGDKVYVPSLVFKEMPDEA